MGAACVEADAAGTHAFVVILKGNGQHETTGAQEHVRSPRCLSPHSPHTQQGTAVAMSPFGTRHSEAILHTHFTRTSAWQGKKKH